MTIEPIRFKPNSDTEKSTIKKMLAEIRANKEVRTVFRPPTSYGPGAATASYYVVNARSNCSDAIKRILNKYGGGKLIEVIERFAEKEHDNPSAFRAGRQAWKK